MPIRLVSMFIIFFLILFSGCAKNGDDIIKSLKGNDNLIVVQPKINASKYYSINTVNNITNSSLELLNLKVYNYTNLDKTVVLGNKTHNWRYSTLDLGVYGAYPVFVPHSEGVLGDLGGFYNGLIMYGDGSSNPFLMFVDLPTLKTSTITFNRDYDSSGNKRMDFDTLSFFGDGLMVDKFLDMQFNPILNVFFDDLYANNIILNKILFNSNTSKTNILGNVWGGIDMNVISYEYGNPIYKINLWTGDYNQDGISIDVNETDYKANKIITFKVDSNEKAYINTNGSFFSKEITTEKPLKINESTGITDDSAYWVCVDSDCTNTCKLNITGGIIVGCS